MKLFNFSTARIFFLIVVFSCACVVTVQAQPLPENEVVIEQDLKLPVMPLGEGPEIPVCVDGATGLLVAGCDGVVGPQGPEGPPGPEGPQGEPGSLVLGGLSCGEGEYLTGFTPEGGLICTFVSKCRPIGCDDQSVCTTDECNETIGICVNDPGPHEGDPCDDGDLCTVGELCSGGVCSPGLPIDCNDQNACTADGCDGATGLCFNDGGPLEGAPCEDGDLCTVGETCAAGVCSLGLPVDCDDGNICTADLCDSSSGLCINNWASQVGTPCDDGNLCTVEDQCGEFGACFGFPIDCNDGDACTQDFCDGGSGSCSNIFEPDGTPCDSQIEGGQCEQGVCIPPQ
jgi:hypothetical protein